MDERMENELSGNSALIVGADAVGSNPRLQLSQWSDLKHLGHHGAYSLYTATRYGRKYFIKTLAEKYRTQPQWQRLLFKEFELGISLDHPAIARTIGWETIPPIGEALVMEFIDGSELRSWLESDKGHDPEARVKVICRIAEALDYIHSLGICHRDLKPDNVLITHRGNRVKLIDFGLGDGDDFMVYKLAGGSKGFGAPEQTNANVQQASTGADIYALGKIMQLLLPEKKYRGIINRCLQKDPQSRPSATAVLQLLRKKSATRRHLLAPIAIALIAISFSLYITNRKPATAPAEPITDTLYIHQTDTVFIETPAAGPSEAAINAVWNKVVTIIDRQIKDLVTLNTEGTEKQLHYLETSISLWQEELYYSLLGIGCSEETATAKRTELGTYMRRRYHQLKMD